MAYRNLTSEEVTRLCSQGCEAEDWGAVLVSDPFDAARIRSVRFSGIVQIGEMEGTIQLEGGRKSPCGLYSSSIHNCTIGRRVFISGAGCLCNYDIQQDAAIENIGSMVTEGETTFGNGVEVEVLNEGGGRAVPMYDHLSAQIAYILALYRHRKKLIGILEGLITQYVATRKSQRGLIGTKTRIQNVSTMRNVWVGEGAVIRGASHLEEGTIAGSNVDPVYIGPGVTASKFIALSGSRIDESAILSCCFIGQGVRIGKQFSAVHSLFFANCELFHGEACSIFAGPYTVSHHKSTLLIAGLFSFYNAGSGSNQSNHMYKLGPIHQGILERGSKTGSFSYLRWPCRVGAFSVVLDKNATNFDSSDLPFSYIQVMEDASYLSPGVNLFTVGTRRDSTKWLKRDDRKDPMKLDLIHCGVFNPYTIGKALKAMRILGNLYEKTPREKDNILYKGLHIKRLMLKTSRRYYEMVVQSYLSGMVVSRLQGISSESTWDQVLQRLKVPKKLRDSEWIDWAGLLLPSAEADELLDRIEMGKINSLEDLSTQFQSLHANRDQEEWNWCAKRLESALGQPVENLTGEQLQQVITDWKDTTIKINNMILQDAIKEFDQISRIGYGIDGGQEENEKDFVAVRGTSEDNSFILALREENERTEQTAANLIHVIREILQ